ncbi:MAG: hypothetical protein JW719_10715 [Pirellulales bacterium]|nr:hypothetical protein [Pirellulales bacterium]
MTPKNENLPPTENDALFDLLADGQLDDARRRELLAGLDDRPGGWRRCALAFLEAQSWREAMDALAHPRASAESTDKSAAAPSVPAKRRPRRDYLTALLGMAASLLLGIGITSLMHDMRWGPSPIGTSPNVASVNPEFSGSPVPVYNEPGLGRDVQLVNLTNQGPDGRPHTAQLPAVQRDRLDEQWLRDLPSAIPNQVTQSLQQAGHDVRSSRQLLPFRMKDGRRLVVPVDQLDVHYVNDPGYQ